MASLSNMDLGRFWTVPNSVSLFRLVLVVPIAVLLWLDGPVEWLLGLVVAVVMSDWLDGRIARWTQSVSDWGKVIDPVADKFAAFMTVAALTFRPADPHLPLWFFWVVIGRDLVILLGGLAIARRSGQIVMSAWAGKAASLWLALTVLSLILRADPPVVNVCIWMATGLFILSLVVYFIRFVGFMRRSDPPRQAGGSASDQSATGSRTGAVGQFV